MPDGSYKDHAKYKKYIELAKCKNYAINKAYEKFYFLPLEKQDFEIIAWEAFIEVEKKFEDGYSEMKFESYFVNYVTWKCKDYCTKYLTNKHKILNIANAAHKFREQVADDYYDFEESSRINHIRKVITQYKEEHTICEKGEVFALLVESLEAQDICKELNWSKSKVYRIIKEIGSDLKLLLD